MRVKFGSWLVMALLSLTWTLAGCGSSSTVSGGAPRPATLTSITVTPSAASVPFGTAQQMTATGHFSDGSSRALASGLTWSSSATTVATVNGSGSVTPVQHGQTTITAAQGSINGSTALTITTALASISLTPGAPGVFVGSSLQFKATGNYDDSTTQDLTASATWTSSDTAKATISNAGLASGLHGGSTTVTANSGSISAQANLTVTALLSNISLSPIGPGIVAHTTRSFTAIGNFNDGTTQDLTLTAKWTSSDLSLATMAINVATGQGVGPVTIIATSTSANGSIVSGTTALNVVSSFYSCAGGCMNGDYAFTLMSADARGPQFFVGSFHADGSGNITGGEMDANTAAGVAPPDTLSGSYVLYADGRGQITFNANTIYSSPVTFRFILSSAGAVGKLAQFDGQGTAEGTFEAQTSGAAINAGTYVFRASGIDQALANVPVGQVGMLTADGSGAITSGVVDINDFGVNTPAVPISNTSTYSPLPDANGRGVLALTVGSVTSNYAYYVVDSGRVNFIQTDVSSGATAMLGRAELQTGGPFSAANLDTSYAFLLERPVGIASCPGCDRTEFAQEGVYLFDAVSSITGTRDNTNFQSNPVTGVTGSYNVTNGGRGNIITQGTDSLRNYVFYLVSPTKAFLLQTTKGNPNAGSFNAPVGEMDQQVGSFSKATLDGNYALNASSLTQSYTEALIWLNFDGAGNIDGIADLSQQGNVSSSVVTATYSAFPNAGRAGITLASPAGANNYILYLESSQSAWVLGTNPALVGGLNKQ
jgi:hypothetical protein